MYLKRQEVPKNWPIVRKGTAYIVKPKNGFEFGVPILIILRDMLKFGKNRTEVKKAITSKFILLNNKLVKDDRTTALLLDTITILPSKKYYRINLNDKGKFIMEEIKENESTKKISKIRDKKMLNGKKIQINLIDGRNYISDIKSKIDDSVLIDFKTSKIEKCLPIKEGAEAIVFEGKHAGKRGTIKGINEKTAELLSNKEKINVLTRQLMVVE
ncbi:MAG: hypothetical protein Q7R52_02105 [archaeon]|nr:hypothetical protein [archaeon]